MRILPSASGGKNYVVYSSSRYSILKRTKLNLRQVFSVYGWLALVAGLFWATIGLDVWWLALPGLLTLGAPWFLRRKAVNHMLKDYRRNNVGLSARTAG
jgi:hypothetical protein